MAATSWISIASIALLVVAATAAAPCGQTPLNMAGTSLSPCLGAISNPSVPVPRGCCDRVSALPPACLCAIVTSQLAQQFRIDPKIAISIPKRCNFSPKARHANSKCGKFTIP